MTRPVSIGIVRVLTTKDSRILRSHETLIKEYLKDRNLIITSRCIDGFPQGIHTIEEEINSIPFVVKTGKELVKDSKVATLIISCAADPGVKELQREVNIPVIGAGSAAAAVALLMGKPVGVLGISDVIPNAVSGLLDDCIVGYAKPVEVTTTLDIETAIDTYISLTRSLIEDKGAKVILLACTGMSTVRLAAILEKRLNVIVVDPVLVSGVLAYYLAKRNGSQYGVEL